MERLQKVIANAGVASRRKAETLIVTGHVTLNGKVVKEMGIKVDSTSDHIEVDGVPLTRERKVYYVLYKPRQVISAVTDDKKRRVVTEYLGDIVERVYPIGRLDYDTSGLLLLTNDGDFANMMMHPKYKVDKTYIAKVSGLPTADMLRQLRKGIVLEKRKTAPAKVKVISTDRRKNTAIVSITIHEGMNHQVKNMLAAVGLPVTKLKRETYGFLTLDGLVSGEYRALKPIEVAEFKKIAELNEKPQHKNRPKLSRHD
ncbi:pseudouridine synthase [Latilactobacillus curvatus]|uniref:Pseudouridine synthase n=1 Tax=Latilactobacillus curvatus TaxID=28038 RepID=A0ABM7QTD2_LATCU|nr:pseudouridine synthase [Latilactobacillus curvatus]BCX29829.1 pseudouridine synthase [Latilactobacillus curvatus]